MAHLHWFEQICEAHDENTLSVRCKIECLPQGVTVQIIIKPKLLRASVTFLILHINMYNTIIIHTIPGKVGCTS